MGGGTDIVDISNVVSETLKIFIAKGRINGALKAAKVLRRNLTPGQLKQILEVQIKEGGSADDIQKTAKLLGHKLTIEELLKIMEVQIKKNLRYMAAKTANLLPEPERIIKLLRVLGMQIKRGELYDAENTITLI